MEQLAGQVAAQLAGTGVEAVAAECDVTDREAVEALADKAWAHFGHVDIAGVFPPIRRAISIDERDARWVLEVNLMGAWYGCSAFGQRFTEQGTPAHILNTGSENSLGVAHAGAAFYTASKHALLGLSDVLRQELPDFIGVSILCPGMVATGLGNSARHRPERFGGPGPEARPASMGLDPADIGRAAVEGIRRGDFYIVTHPPVREIVAERAAEIMAAFDAQAPHYQATKLSTRAPSWRGRARQRKDDPDHGPCRRAQAGPEGPIRTRRSCSSPPRRPPRMPLDCPQAGRATSPGGPRRWAPSRPRW